VSLIESRAEFNQACIDVCSIWYTLSRAKFRNCCSPELPNVRHSAAPDFRGCPIALRHCSLLGVVECSLNGDLRATSPAAQSACANIGLAFWPRRFPRLARSTPREFETEPGTSIRANATGSRRLANDPPLVLVHGLEGSCESGYMLGLAERPPFVADGMPYALINATAAGRNHSRPRFTIPDCPVIFAPS